MYRIDRGKLETHPGFLVTTARQITTLHQLPDQTILINESRSSSFAPLYISFPFDLQHYFCFNSATDIRVRKEMSDYSRGYVPSEKARSSFDELEFTQPRRAYRSTQISRDTGYAVRHTLTIRSPDVIAR